MDDDATAKCNTTTCTEMDKCGMGRGGKGCTELTPPPPTEEIEAAEEPIPIETALTNWNVVTDKPPQRRVNAEEKPSGGKEKMQQVERDWNRQDARLRHMDERNRRKNKSRDGETAHQQYARGTVRTTN
jgi:hypothetical protein